ncbi:phosphate-starvation-inducible E, partial [Pseudomonas aeruginosa]
FHYLALFAIGATVFWAAGAAFLGMVNKGHASIDDILLLFIYLELGAMVGIYFKTNQPYLTQFSSWPAGWHA